MAWTKIYPRLVLLFPFLCHHLLNFKLCKQQKQIMEIGWNCVVGRNCVEIPVRKAAKVLFTDRCRWQNFRPSLLLAVKNVSIVTYTFKQIFLFICNIQNM